MKNTIRFEIKQLTEEGTFEGLLSPYGNKDNGDDIVEKGAYTRTLKNKGSTRPLLWQHRADTPIGELALDDRPDGLWAKGKLLLELPKAKEAYTLIKAGIVKGLSIGFQSVKDEVKDGIRHLKEINLYEGSIVTFPMNEMALVTNVKRRKSIGAPVYGGTNDMDSPEDISFNDELSNVQLWDMRGQLMDALRTSLYKVHSANLSKEDTISALDDVLTQHKAAYMDFAPDYYDAQNTYGGYQQFSARVAEIKAAGKTKTVDGEQLTAGDFLIVGDPQDTSTWKLPWKFSTDDKTKSHLRNALALFDQLLGVSAEDTAKAKKRLISLCESHGIDVSDDFKKSIDAPEVKKGARFSAETKGTMAEACKGIQGHVDSLMALLSDAPGEVDDDGNGPTPTASSKSAGPKPDPGDSHSALMDSIKEIELLLK